MSQGLGPKIFKFLPISNEITIKSTWNSNTLEDLEKGLTVCAPDQQVGKSKPIERRVRDNVEIRQGRGANQVSLPCNMVAAMNELLSSTSATNSIRTSTTKANNNIINSKIDKDHHHHHHHHHHLRQNNRVNNTTTNNTTIGFPLDFDHMYASMQDGRASAAATLASPGHQDGNKLNDAASEIKHLKELLLLHLDLIQQQSEQICTKDKLLAALRQENEQLKLRLERMDRRVSLQKVRSEHSENSLDCPGPCSPQSNSLHESCQNEQINNESSLKIRLNTSGGITTVKNDNFIEQERLDWSNKKKRRSDSSLPLLNNVKRQRGVSSSSTVSSETVQDCGKNDKKDKSDIKKESFLTTEEHFYTAVGDSSYNLVLKEPSPPGSPVSLEVPSWRIKNYTSCYTMEGTENLEDEIFNKRHQKLENDERRRKRWDFQRIREQRHIEKLKQRQEKQNHQPTCLNTNHIGPCPVVPEEQTVNSLWPDLDQIQSIQVEQHLPMSAFGDFIPGFNANNFTLPWLINSKSRSRPKRLSSSSRRKSSRR